MNDKIERDSLGNLVFHDPEGRIIKAEPNKFIEDTEETLCKRCIKDYRTCDNAEIKDSEQNGGPIRTKDGCPIVYYCVYFLQ